MPVDRVVLLWKVYNQFEQGLIKLTARKHLQEYTPMFMTASYCLIELSNITKGLRLDTLSRLPPAPGYEAYQDYTRQVELWKRWIQWKQGDPLVLAKEDPAALMALMFWPPMWFDAAGLFFANRIDNERLGSINVAMVANPDRCLLYFKYADRLEASTIIEGGVEALIRKGQLFRKHYDDLLNRLYELVRKIKPKEKEDRALIGDAFELANPYNAEDYDYDKTMILEQLQVITETISTVFINLLYATGRVQVHGKMNEPLGGNHQIFADARTRGNINSNVHVANENFVLEYLKFLVAINDITNTRAVFVAFVDRVTAEKARKIQSFLDSRADIPIEPWIPAAPFAFSQQHNNANQSRKPYLHRISIILPETGRDYLNHPRSPTSATGHRRSHPRDARQKQHLRKSRDRNILDPDDGMRRGGYGHEMYKNNQWQLQQHQPQPMKFQEPPAPSELPPIIGAPLSIVPGPEKYQSASLTPEAIVELLRNLNLPDHVLIFALR
ncbi:hypothetical protein HOY82DRAFT_597377 [Tuber indicum]|nr:hypothetical protein HOY82DRAFT_597377 [Tuber indicum]